MLIIAVCLAFFGLCLGSFVNALVWRLKTKKNFISGRSQCVHCGHRLAASDLIPIISYLMLRGHCRYCKKPISTQYPAVELVMAGVFVLSYIFWPAALSGGNLILFISWLISSIGLLALAVYDLKWMILPSKIIYPTLLVSCAGLLAYLIFYAPAKGHLAAMWLTSVVIASGLFWVLHTVSSGRWIGYGDVRLGLVTGTLLHDPALSVLMIFLSSVLGSLAVLPAIALGKTKMTGRMPYGPFLIAAAFICLLFGQSIIDWYRQVFLP